MFALYIFKKVNLEMKFVFFWTDFWNLNTILVNIYFKYLINYFYLIIMFLIVK